MKRYELNIAVRGQHLCRVIIPPQPLNEAIAVARGIADRFPASEGFACQLTRWEETGKEISIA